MKTKLAPGKYYCFLLFALRGLLFTMIFSLSAKAQEQITSQLEEGKTVTCKIQVNNKTYELSPNEIGYFPRKANIPPLDSVPIEITYPSGRTGEKVLISIIDGGKLDNGKAVKVVTLDNQNKLSFGFKVANYPGLYRVLVKKGNDTNIVQLWVGAEPASVKK